MPKGALLAVENDSDEETMESLSAKLDELMARKAEIDRFADQGMRNLYLKWLTPEIEAVRQKISSRKA